MELSVTKVIEIKDGEPWRDNGEELTLGGILKFAIRKPVERETLDGVKLYHLGMLWDQIERAEKKAEPLDLPTEDIVLLKERVAKTVPDPLLVKRVWDALEAK